MKDLYKINPLKIGGLYKLRLHPYPYWVLDYENNSSGPWLRQSFIYTSPPPKHMENIKDNSTCLLYKIEPRVLHVVYKNHKSIFFRKLDKDNNDYTLNFLNDWSLIDFKKTMC